MLERSIPDGSLEATRDRTPAVGPDVRTWPRPYDIRSRQELLQRRQLLSTMRRFARVLGLHLIDGLLIVAVASALATEWMGFPSARPYIPAIAGIVLLSLNAVTAYDSGDARRDRRRLFGGIAIALLVLACLVVFPPHLSLSWAFLASLGAAGFLALGLGRHLAEQLVRQVYLHGIGLRRALLIGTLDEVGRAIQQLREGENADHYFIGHLSPNGDTDPTALGVLPDLARIVEESDVQEVIVATALPPQVLRQVADCCFDRGIILFVFPAMVASIECQAEPVRVGSCPLLHLFPSRMRVPSLVLKRTFDWVLALVALVVMAPVMALIALAIRVDSPGPIFFRQERVGRGGKRFRIWKFRSMRVDADAAKPELAHLNSYPDRRLFKLPNDPRTTRVGRFLRRSSLDELPQLLNVLRGEMSLVGPRPPLPSEVADYEPHHFVRLAVVPGITGPWQVNGRNLITDFEEVVRLERSYIHSWSLWQDVRILLRTLPVVISGEGAY